MKRYIFVLLLSALLSACATTYELPENVDSSRITVRSPQGQKVAAAIYDSVETCSEKKVLKSSKGNRSSKTYNLPSSEVVLLLMMQPGEVNSYACRVTLKMNAEQGQHYVVDLISDQGKQRCNNRIFTLNDKDSSINAKYIDAAGSLLWSSKRNFCEKHDFKDIASETGRFTSTAYRNTATGTGLPGVISTSTPAVKER